MVCFGLARLSPLRTRTSSNLALGISLNPPSPFSALGGRPTSRAMTTTSMMPISSEKVWADGPQKGQAFAAVSGKRTPIAAATRAQIVSLNEGAMAFRPSKEGFLADISAPLIVSKRNVARHSEAQDARRWRRSWGLVKRSIGRMHTDYVGDFFAHLLEIRAGEIELDFRAFGHLSFLTAEAF